MQATGGNLSGERHEAWAFLGGGAAALEMASGREPPAASTVAPPGPSGEEVALAASALAELRHGNRNVGVETLKRLLRHG